MNPEQIRFQQLAAKASVQGADAHDLAKLICWSRDEKESRTKEQIEKCLRAFVAGRQLGRTFPLKAFIAEFGLDGK